MSTLSPRIIYSAREIALTAFIYMKLFKNHILQGFNTDNIMIQEINIVLDYQAKTHPEQFTFRYYLLSIPSKVDTTLKKYYVVRLATQVKDDLPPRVSVTGYVALDSIERQLNSDHLNTAHFMPVMW